MWDNLAYQEDIPVELIDGVPVAMSPASINHTYVAGNIYRMLGNYLEGKRCVPIADGAKVFLTEKDRFSPDVMVVCDTDKIKEDGVHGAPDLVVEVLSPSTMRSDRTYKKDVYGKSGVKEYWLVNPADRSVEVYLSRGTELVLDNVYVVHPDWVLREMGEEKRAAVETHFKSSLFEDLEISLAAVFARTF